MSTAATLNHRLQNTLAYNGNIMLVAIIALLLIILFLLLLHVYAKWFLSTARNHIPRSSPHVITTRFHSPSLFTTIHTTLSVSSKGLEPSVISALPIFVYQNKHACNKPECVICLSVFEDEQVGRKLPNCCHVFHVECIDMWLYSHSTCPICRDPVIYEGNDGNFHEGSLTVSGESASEIVAIQVLDNENAEVENLGDSLSASSSSSSLKRTMSKNIFENKIHPSSNF